MVDRLTGSEDFLLNLEGRVDAILKKFDSGGGTTLRDGFKTLGELEERQKSLVENIDQLEKKLSNYSDSFTKVQGEIDAAVSDAETARLSITELQQEVERFRIVKERIDSLNTLSEYVKSKIKSLENQKLVVEKANEDAGRLNALTWDIDSKLKQLQLKIGNLEKTEKNIARIDQMLQQSQTSINEIPPL